MSEQQAITGYQLVKCIFKEYCDDPLTKLISEIAKGETEYLEFKATCVFDKNAPGNKDSETQDDLSWNIAREIFALYNSKGGALVIGIDDEFRPVKLPNFDPRRQNDYLRTMIRDKIFPSDFVWKTKNGREVYKCNKTLASNLINRALHIEYSKYQGEKVAVLFVEPAPCDSKSCIQIAWTKDGGDTYDQLPVRQSGNTGGVRTITQYDEKNDYQQRRLCTDTEFGQIWASCSPSLMYGSTRTPQRSHRTAIAYSSTDPSCDPLIRALDGQESETEFAPDTEFDGKYRIIRKIGQGGMGIVYEVEHLDLKEKRAIKVFAPATPDDLLRRKFLSEARLLAKFKHPGLVKVHNLAVAKDTKTLYYEMDLVLAPTGKPMTLKDVFKKVGTDSAPNNRKLREWFSQLCNVLDYLHCREATVHRDIKLDNILVNSDGMAVLSDFGIARVEDASLKEKLGDQMTMHPTMTGVGDANIGTSEYQAPELETEKASDKSDVYALGVVFFKLLTRGKFTGESGADLKKLLKKCPRFWRRTLPKLLEHTKDKRIGNLRKFAVRKHYPGMGPRHMIHCLCGSCTAITLGLITTCIIVNTTAPSNGRILERIKIPFLSSVYKTKSFHEVDPATNKTETVHSQECDQSKNKIKIAEQDVHELNTRYIRKDQNGLFEFRRPDPADPDTNIFGADIFSAIEAYHARIFTTWEKIKEALNQSWSIQEIITWRRDIVEDCIHIRQDAIDQLQQIINAGDHPKAMKFRRAINIEFRHCGLSEIPYPSFKPAPR